MAVVNVKSEIAGNVWKIQVKAGDRIEAEGEIMILESMKMEIPVLSPKAGIIKELKVQNGAVVTSGQVLALLDDGVAAGASTPAAATAPAAPTQHKCAGLGDSHR